MVGKATFRKAFDDEYDRQYVCLRESVDALKLRINNIPPRLYAKKGRVVSSLVAEDTYVLWWVKDDDHQLSVEKD
ncbi:hypothetical protein OH492_26380 [Vibrio chagasii]|nr:hypothetical protein [Vibrio chagasii]